MHTVSLLATFGKRFRYSSFRRDPFGLKRDTCRLSFVLFGTSAARAYTCLCRVRTRAARLVVATTREPRFCVLTKSRGVAFFSPAQRLSRETKEFTDLVLVFISLNRTAALGRFGQTSRLVRL